MRILMFGPNGSGKGTQSAILVKKHQLAHVESGGIFRHHIQGDTALGRKAKVFMDKGELVPDALTIPMVLDRLKGEDCEHGWILDGFPRNPSQARALIQGLQEEGETLDAVIEIVLAREIAKSRLMGRRSCPNGHPNNTAFAAIAPVQTEAGAVCWKCGEAVTVRKDDVNEAAIDQRLDIYFDDANGTIAAVDEVESWAATRPETMFLKIAGAGDIAAISREIESRLG